jgi:hypothetical protein
MPAGEVDENAASPGDGASDEYARYFKSPLYEARNRFVANVSELSDLGILKLSLTHAADLVAVDMFGSGAIEAEVPGLSEDAALSRNDPVVLEALKPQRKMIQERLTESVVGGTLKTIRLERDVLTGAIDAESTVLDYDALVNWLEACGYKPGDWMDEYVYSELGVQEDLAHALFDIRNIRSQLHGPDADQLSAQKRLLADFAVEANADFAAKTAQELRGIIATYAAQVAYLQGELDARRSNVEAPTLRPKSRNTLYRLIAALAVAAGVNPKERGAASTIAALTERVGLAVGDDTVRKVLVDLPDSEVH